MARRRKQNNMDQRTKVILVIVVVFVVILAFAYMNLHQKSKKLEKEQQQVEAQIKKEKEKKDELKKKKEYIKTKEFIEKMAEGVPILDTVTRKCKVEMLGKYKFRIILTQGLNRQIRRMCEYLGYKVTRLERIRVMNITLGELMRR